MNNTENIKLGLKRLSKTVNALANIEATTPDFEPNSISGNAINGGKITNFRSQGIVDLANQIVLAIDNDGITVDAINTDVIKGSTVKVEGNFDVAGTLTAKKLEVEELLTENKIQKSIDFTSPDLEMVGLQWRTGDKTKQLVLRNNKFYVSDSINLHRNAHYEIDGISVLSSDTLGPTIVRSELRQVGRLTNLQTDGDLNIDDFVLYDSGSMRFSIGAETPNAQFSVASNEAEFIVDPDFDNVRIGSYTTSQLEIITDNTARITIKDTGNVNVKGKLGINTDYPGSDVDFQVKGAVRIQDHKIEYKDEIPIEGNYNKGDIVYNNNPIAGGYIGWVCLESGTPGEWKPFGGIANE